VRIPIAALLLVAVPTVAVAQRASSYPMSRDSIAARLADLARIHTPEGIEALEQVDVNGSKQWISIRGLNRANPILLFVHGGPGSAMMGMSWAYQKPWEDFFTVVNWDQRGIGKNFSPADTARLGPTMTEEQHVQDAIAVVRHVLARLGQDRVVLMGYSWGTVFTPEVVRRHPELFHAWVGVGVSSRGGGGNGEAELYARVLELARRRRDTTAVRELEAMAPYPRPGKVDIPRALQVRKWVRRYDGGWYGKPDFRLYFALNEWGAAYTSEEARRVNAAMGWVESRLTFTEQDEGDPKLARFPVPVVFMMGRYDLHTPYGSAKAFFDRIEAPSKKFVSFERSSHMIMFEEPGRFLMTLVNDVLPLAGGERSFDPQPDPPVRP